jgi:hypothetical protein
MVVEAAYLMAPTDRPAAGARLLRPEDFNKK